MSSCIFCEILAGRSEGSFVHRDERVSAFMDIAQWTPGHVLVVPNVHAPMMADLDSRTGGEIFAVAMRVGAALRASRLAPDGINLHLADGEAAGQEIFHLHLHVIPRFPGDGFGIRCARLDQSVDRALLDERAGEIRATLDARC